MSDSGDFLNDVYQAPPEYTEGVYAGLEMAAALCDKRCDEYRHRAIDASGSEEIRHYIELEAEARAAAAAIRKMKP